MRKTDLPLKPFDVVIQNGTLLTASDTFQSDLGIHEGKIAAIGKNLQGAQTIDATNMLVVPGGVDPHVHLEMPVGSTRSSDDWLTGTIAAACGGTTTVLDFAEPTVGENLSHCLKARRELAESKAVIDFGLHMTITNDTTATLSQIPGLVNKGCTSFKTYLTYEGFRLGDPALLNVLAAVRDANGIVMVHAENDAIIQYMKLLLRREHKTAPRFHALSRPSIAEVEAVQCAIALAEITGTRLYMVHISTAGAADAIRNARDKGATVFGETCPQYLLLTEKELERPGLEGAKFICSPPLRSAEDNTRLWKALTENNLQTIGTDHCPFFFKGQKNQAGEDYEKIPGGLPGIEARLALIHTFGVVSGRFSLNRWVQLCSTEPARIFGLYPRKGSLTPGADADVVIFDPAKKVRITQPLFHEQVDYTPYEGLKLQGYPVMTLSHGKVIVEKGKFIGTRGSGRYLAREVQS